MGVVIGTVDNIKNIQRIIDVLKADDIIFDNGETEGKLRLVEFGDPSISQKKQTRCHMCTLQHQTISRQHLILLVQLYLINIHQTSVQYEIVLVAHARSKTVNSQKQLYTLVTGIRDA